MYNNLQIILIFAHSISYSRPMKSFRSVVLCSIVFIHIHLFAISFNNPILPYDYSDPDICRIGDTYLLTSSSFNNIPGLQILTSTDLLHWHISDAALRYSVPGYADSCQVRGNFVWAPSIREHNDTLYIFYGDPDRGIYCVRADIKGGLHFPLAWEEPVLVMSHKGYIDPCPLWDDDGRVYLCHGVAGSREGLKSVLMMAELTSDALSVKTPSRIIFDGHEEHPTCEGPKLYKKDGYYYIMHPAGGVRTGWQVVQRSRHIYGPYELRVTLRQGSTSINGPHQGGWVETPEGEQWFVHFQDVGVAGRIVHLQPLRWEDGWPVMGNEGEPMLSYGTGKKEINPWASMLRRDEFDSTALALDWQFAGGHINPAWYFCDAANSRLRLYSYPATSELMPNMLLQKIPAAAVIFTARVRFMPNTHKKMQGAERAGMIVVGKQSFCLDAPAGEWVYLRVKLNNKQRGQFYISTDGKHWTKSGEVFQAVEGYWIGAQVGLFCTRDNRRFNDAGWMDVDWFEASISNKH